MHGTNRASAARREAKHDSGTAESPWGGAFSRIASGNLLFVERYEDETALQAGRTDLIGGGCDALVPAAPPKEALRARRERANREARGEYVHTIPNPGKEGGREQEGHKSRGYRPQRKTAKRRDRR
jgi:hypothetical protein